MRFRTCLLAAVLSAGCSPLVVADEAVAPPATTLKPDGAIVGVITDSARRPIAGATVTAIRADGSAIRATVSDSNGLYTFPDMTPGEWSVSYETDGYAQTSPFSLNVLASKATRHDVAIETTNGIQSPGASPAAPATAAVVAQNPTAPAAKGIVARIADALTAPSETDGVDNDTPFAFGDFTWVNGAPRNHRPVFDTKFFTPDIRLDVHYMDDFNHPQDHTIVGSTEEFRSGEFQLEQVSFGGDFHYDNVRARFLSMMGLFATTTPRNDASSGVGQWDLADAYRYLSEANAGYHFDVNHGLNIDAGIFVSYIGLFSYYNFDNWAYQPSFVSSNTPWFFNGMRIQWFPTNKLKIEPWIINGWQSYARFNQHLGFGGQILYTPNENVKLVFNNYGVGEDNLAYSYPGQPTNPLSRTTRIHTDDSILVKYYNGPGTAMGISKAAFSFTFDIGCEYGGGVTCTGGPNKANFIGAMLYNRVWFHSDLFAVTLGGGFMNNPGRYLALLPPINGATAQSGTPYFTENPGQKLSQWDTNINLQYMPRQWITWWSEFGFRHSNVPYFAGTGGVTPPGGNNGSPTNYVCNSGASSGFSNLGQATTACGGTGGVWYPDLRTRQAILSAGVMVKF